MENLSEIVIAKQEDIPAMVRVINAAFAIERFLEGQRTDHENLRQMMEKGEFLLARKSQGGLMASVYVELRGERGYFGMLAVDPRYQHQGLGRRMVGAAEEYCRGKGAKAMDLAVLSLRAELPALYGKLGYAESGTEEFRPSRPLKPGVECHCIMMSKLL
jgi:ribosomal protein S18 acetylase RimI-like enzyme